MLARASCLLLLAATGANAACDDLPSDTGNKCTSCLSHEAGTTGCACEYNARTGECRSTMGFFGCTTSDNDLFETEITTCPDDHSGNDKCEAQHITTLIEIG